MPSLNIYAKYDIIYHYGWELQMLNTLGKTGSNDPLHVRRIIVLSSAIISFIVFVLSFVLFQTHIFVVAIYFIIVTAMDFYLFSIKCIKSSDYVDPIKLLAENEASPEQLDAYSASRRRIRLFSLCAGLLTSAACLFVLPEWFQYAFCAGFIISTGMGLAFSKIDIKNKYPPAFVRDDRYYVPGQPTVGGVSVNMYTAGKSTGFTYGPIDPNR